MALMLDHITYYRTLHNFIQSIYAFDNFIYNYTRENDQGPITLIALCLSLKFSRIIFKLIFGQKSLFQLPKHVGNINIYQNVDDTTMIRSQD